MEIEGRESCYQFLGPIGVEDAGASLDAGTEGGRDG